MVELRLGEENVSTREHIRECVVVHTCEILCKHARMSV